MRPEEFDELKDAYDLSAFSLDAILFKKFEWAWQTLMAQDRAWGIVFPSTETTYAWVSDDVINGNMDLLVFHNASKLYEPALAIKTSVYGTFPATITALYVLNDEIVTLPISTVREFNNLESLFRDFVNQVPETPDPPEEP